MSILCALEKCSVAKPPPRHLSCSQYADDCSADKVLQINRSDLGCLPALGDRPELLSKICRAKPHRRKNQPATSPAEIAMIRLTNDETGRGRVYFDLLGVTPGQGSRTDCMASAQRGGRDQHQMLLAVNDWSKRTCSSPTPRPAPEPVQSIV